MMWELIRRNRRNSVFLFLYLFLFLALLGYVVGGAVEPGRGPLIGLSVALLVFALGSITALSAASKVVLSMAGATEVSHDNYPQLFNVVEEMRIAAGLSVMPRIYLIPETYPNAFAAGTKPEKSSIAVTAGLVTRLNRDELQGVIAHEISHIVNRDALFMTFSATLLGSIVYLSEFFLRTARHSRFSCGRSRPKGQAQIVFFVLALVCAILGPIIATLLHLAVSRKREYLADASAVRLTRCPEGLASALEKISSPLSATSGEYLSRAIAPMCTVNPLNNNADGIWSTHPPVFSRIKILRSMTEGAGYMDYQRAYSLLTGRKKEIIPPSGLWEEDRIPVRKPAVDSAPVKDGKNTFRETGNLIRATQQYSFVTCICGVKMKIPPGLPESAECPRCGATVLVPHADKAVSASGLEAESRPDVSSGDLKPGSLVYTRKSAGWETFACKCGRKIQLSPAFRGTVAVCSRCRANIQVRQTAA